MEKKKKPVKPTKIHKSWKKKSEEYADEVFSHSPMFTRINESFVEGAQAFKNKAIEEISRLADKRKNMSVEEFLYFVNNLRS